MGNTLIKSNSDRNINDSILGNRVKEILRESYIPVKDETGKDVPLKINEMVACCTGNASEGEVNKNQFITVKLPSALDENNKFCSSSGRCIESANLGLQFPNTKCNKNWIPGKEGTCDRLMVNKCARELHDAGCLKIKVNKNGKKVRVWDAKNKNCFDKRGNLIYGSEECVCLNSATGFNLNMDPSTKISDHIYSKNENPYGIEGPDTGIYSGDNNTFTKYSLDIFGYEPQYQYPNVFDSRCAGRQKSVAAGVSNAYKLSNYKNTPSICLNQINIKDSDIGQANMSNIKQNNNCNSAQGKPLKVEENPKEREARINRENEIKRKEAERIEKEKKEKLELERKRQQEAIIEEEKAAEQKRLALLKKINDDAKAKKQLDDLKKEQERIRKEKEILEEEAAYEKAEKEMEKENLQMKLLEAEQKQIALQEEAQQMQEEAQQMQEEAQQMQEEAEQQAKYQEEEDKKEKELDQKQNLTIIIGGSVLFFVIVILIIILLMRSGKSEE